MNTAHTWDEQNSRTYQIQYLRESPLVQGTYYSPEMNKFEARTRTAFTRVLTRAGHSKYSIHLWRTNVVFVWVFICTGHSEYRLYFQLIHIHPKTIIADLGPLRMLCLYLSEGWNIWRKNQSIQIPWIVYWKADYCATAVYGVYSLEISYNYTTLVLATACAPSRLLQTRRRCHCASSPRCRPNEYVLRAPW